MPKWIIDKTFDFCYAHRTWTQVLNGEYANDLKCACRHLHGHEGKVQVFLEGEDLDTTGMITDFRHLEWLKKWINQYIDHKFILDRNDPLYDKLIGDKILKPVKVTEAGLPVGYNLDLTCLQENTPEYEYYEGFFIVDFVPTSEKLSQWLQKVVQEKMLLLGIKVSRIDWWETPRSRSTFIV